MTSIRLTTVADKEILADFQIAMALETEGVTLDRETVIRGIQGLFDVPARGYYLVAEDAD